MARVEFGQRTHAGRLIGAGSGSRRGQASTAFPIATRAALTLLTAAGLTAAGLTAVAVAEPTVRPTKPAVAVARPTITRPTMMTRPAFAVATRTVAVPAGWAGAPPGPDDPIGDGTPPAEQEPSEPPATGPPPVDPTPTPPAETPPGEPPPVEPTSTPTAPPPVDPPPTAGPGPTGPLPVPTTTQPRPPQPGQPPRRGVAVTTSDVTLTRAYWGARNTTTDLHVTVANTGDVPQLIRLRYTLPPGVTDAGTRGCSATGGGTYRCGAWNGAAGVRFSTRILLRVDGEAWRRMPLGGSVQVTATDPARPGSGAVTDGEGFAVLFPPGPPAAGVSLTANEVSFDVTGQPTTLDVRLGNTGRTDAAGAIEVILPAGVTVPAAPAGCRSTGTDPPSPGQPSPVPASPVPAGTGQPGTGQTNADQSGTARIGCDLGTVPAGKTATVRLPVAATLEAQRMAPLSGAVIGTLTPNRGRVGRMQMSFRILAVAASAPETPAGATPISSQGVLPRVLPASQPDAGLTGVQLTAISLIVVSGLLVVLALTLATRVVRRRSH